MPERIRITRKTEDTLIKRVSSRIRVTGATHLGVPVGETLILQAPVRRRIRSAFNVSLVIGPRMKFQSSGGPARLLMTEDGNIPEVTVRTLVIDKHVPTGKFRIYHVEPSS